MPDFLKTAFVLAAGRGERLKPLTDKIPKPLLTVHGKPLLDHVLENLVPLSLEKVVLNAWHLGNQIEEYALGRKSHFPFKIVVSHEKELLGTGGGLLEAWKWMGETPFLMVNGDCLWKGDIEGFVKRSLNSSRPFDASWWLVPPQKDQTVIGVSKEEEIVQIGELWKKSLPSQTACFSGVQLFRNLNISVLPKSGGIVSDYWIPELKNGQSLRGDFTGLHEWIDIGTPERLASLG